MRGETHYELVRELASLCKIHSPSSPSTGRAAQQAHRRPPTRTAEHPATYVMRGHFPLVLKHCMKRMAKLHDYRSLQKQPKMDSHSKQTSTALAHRSAQGRIAFGGLSRSTNRPRTPMHLETPRPRECGSGTQPQLTASAAIWVMMRRAGRAWARRAASLHSVLCGRVDGNAPSAEAPIK